MKTLFFTLFFFTTLLCQAQSWQWGMRGGGDGDATSPARPDDIIDMDTDPNGNIYTVSSISSASTVTLGDTALITYGGMDILVASYNCNGGLRWKKVIGGSESDYANALRIDTLGHVFVSGYVDPVFFGGVHFDTDTVMPSNNYKSGFLVQYDTSGNLKWLRQYTPDTVPLARSNYYYAYDMYADKNGDVTMLCYLLNGLLSGGGNHVITTPGMYLLKYNAAGNITAVTPVQMSITENITNNITSAIFYNLRITKVTKDKIIFSGAENTASVGGISHISFDSQPVNGSMFIVCFNTNGQLLWKTINTAKDDGGIFSYRPFIDTKSNLFLSCTSVDADTIGFYVFRNRLSALLYGLPGFIKIDTLGNVLKGKNASSLTGNSSGVGVCVINDKIYTSGSYTKIRWDSTWYIMPDNEGSDIYMVGLDTGTLAVVSADSLKSAPGSYDGVSAMVSDNKGNIYIGGTMPSSLYVNHDTLTSAGGVTDFFIAKYGTANCGAVMPLTLLSFTARAVSSRFSPGESRGEVLLNWTTAREVNVSHFEIERSADGREFNKIGTAKAGRTSYGFTDNSPLTIHNYYRLKMMDKDGQYTYSNIEQVKLVTGNGVNIYPNPATAVVNIYSKNMTGVVVRENTGRLVLSKVLFNTDDAPLNISTLQKGMYVIQVTNTSGESKITKLVVIR